MALDADRHRTGDVWHVELDGVGAGQPYLYRVDGPYEPARGMRFDANRQLIDPYARALTGSLPPRHLIAELPPVLPKCLVTAGAFDWRGDRPLRRPLARSVIYETQVKAFTAHHSAAVREPGTFQGLVEKLPYLQELGVTAVELLPVQETDEFVDAPQLARAAAGKAAAPGNGTAPLSNLWGYNPLALFAPRAAFGGAAAQREPGGQVSAFKEMVRALHEGGIEVILDMVFNHSCEGGADGSVVSYRGLDNSVYYLLDGADPGRYLDFTGCKNTLDCNHPVVRRMIIDCLRYWVMDMHVDGFRFDLASVLSRDRSGALRDSTPLLEAINEDPVLADSKLIAEPWDAAGAYQVGRFGGRRWAEWNDRYRDDVRRFWRGDAATAGALATRLTGSSDLYQHHGRRPAHSVNFVTAHDGFTANDLVSYASKHNQANGAGNNDGTGQNFSANYGVEGPTAGEQVEAVRRRQVKNLLATLLLSVGTPMLLGGDELRRTQRGNNNAYCQDNDVSWYDWAHRERHRDVLRFCRELMRLRARHPALHRNAFYAATATGTELAWYDARANPPQWQRDEPQLALVLSGAAAPAAPAAPEPAAGTTGEPLRCDLYLMLNAVDAPIDVTLPRAPGGGSWRLLIDTNNAPPADIQPPESALALADQAQRTVAPRSLIVLAADPA